MSTTEEQDVRTRMEVAFELYRFAESMMRMNLRRENPGATDEEIERQLLAWIHSRPDAPSGDASGPHFRPAPRPWIGSQPPSSE